MDHSNEPPPAFWRSPAGISLLVLGAVAGVLLLAEHWAHALGVVPYLFILACPLMHRFMHHGHGHGQHGGRHPGAPRDDSARQERQNDW